MIVGIIGSGQLSRMMMLAGLSMGIDFIVLAPEAKSSTRSLAEHFLTDFDPFDTRVVDKFIKSVDIITYENENIPRDFIQYISQRKSTHPHFEALSTAQDRLLEKNLFHTLDIPTNRFQRVDSKDDLHKAVGLLGYPLVVKARRNGYDGKDQFVLKNQDDIHALPKEICIECIAESWVDFDREVSIIGLRDADGVLRFYDLCENQHDAGILLRTHNQKHDALCKLAAHYLERVMSHFNYIGVATLEFFVKDNMLIANEIAPRVHNSGHWTIEGAVTSQFENHVRAICRLPLGSTESIGCSTLFNCIGRMPSHHAVLAVPNTHYHDYLKSPQPKRKLGHITHVRLDKDSFQLSQSNADSIVALEDIVAGI